MRSLPVSPSSPGHASNLLERDLLRLYHWKTVRNRTAARDAKIPCWQAGRLACDLQGPSLQKQFYMEHALLTLLV